MVFPHQKSNTKKDKKKKLICIIFLSSMSCGDRFKFKLNKLPLKEMKTFRPKMGTTGTAKLLAYHS